MGRNLLMATLALGICAGASLDAAAKTSKSAVEATQGVFQGVFAAFTSGNYRALARWVHPKRGLRVYYSIAGNEVKLSRRAVTSLQRSKKTYNFGNAPGSGMPIKITGHDFFFGKRTSVPNGAGPLPDWKRIFRPTSQFGFNRALSTAFEPGNGVPKALKNTVFWSVRYRGTKKFDYHDFGEARLFFAPMTRSRLKGKLRMRAAKKRYRLVGIVMAAPYSP